MELAINAQTKFFFGPPRSTSRLSIYLAMDICLKQPNTVAKLKNLRLTYFNYL